MDYWKSKVLPKIKVVFAKSGGKKAAAAELLKSFNESKVLLLLCCDRASFDDMLAIGCWL